MWLLQFHCCRSPCPPTGVPPRCPESMELLESNLPCFHGSGPDAPAYHENPPPDAAWYSAPLGAGHFLVSSHCASRMGMDLDMIGIDHQPLEIRLIYYIQQLCPDAPVPPTAKTAMSVLPIPVIRGQVPPGCPGAQNPKYPIQKQPVVEDWPTHLTCPPGKWSFKQSQTRSVRSCRRCDAAISCSYHTLTASTYHHFPCFDDTI